MHQALALTATVNASGIYNNTAVVSGDQSDPNSGNNQASVTLTPVSIIAVDDDFSASTIGSGLGGTTATVYTNDTLNGAAFAPGAVTPTIMNDGGLTGVSINPADGTLSVPSGTPANTYVVTYQICDALNPSVCDSAQVTIVVIADAVDSADLSVTKTASPDPVAPDSDLSYTIVVSNSGPDAASSVSWSDTLPAGATFVSVTAPNGSWSCVDPGTGSAGVVSCSTLSFAVGDSAIFSLVVHIPATYSGASPIVNTAAVTSNTSDPNGTNNTATASTVFNPPPDMADLSVTKSVDNPTPNIGDTVRYTITISNGGPSVATGVIVSESLESGLSVVSGSESTSQGSYDSGSGLWTVGSLGVGSSATLTLNATVNASGSYGNTAAVVGSDQPDPSPVNNQIRIILSPGETTPEVTPPVIPPTGEPTAVVAVPTSLPITIADPMIAKDVSAPFAQPDGPISWTITVTNPNSVPIHNITVIDNLPPQAELVSATATAGSISTTGQTVVITIEGRVRSDASGAVITNVASLTSAENPTPHTAQATVLRVTELPRTGETPWWRTPLLALAIGTLGLCGWMFVRR